MIYILPFPIIHHIEEYYFDFDLIPYRIRSIYIMPTQITTEIEFATILQTVSGAPVHQILHPHGCHFSYFQNNLNCTMTTYDNYNSKLGM